jgi:hypothetical protein
MLNSLQDLVNALFFLYQVPKLELSENALRMEG